MLNRLELINHCLRYQNIWSATIRAASGQIRQKQLSIINMSKNLDSKFWETSHVSFFVTNYSTQLRTRDFSNPDLRLLKSGPLKPRPETTKTGPTTQIRTWEAETTETRTWDYLNPDPRHSRISHNSPFDYGQLSSILYFWSFSGPRHIRRQ